MRHLRWVAVAAVMAACVGFLVHSAAESATAYYRTVAEVRTQGVGSAETVRVLGVVQDDVQRSDGGLQVRFTASGGTASMPVEYRGSLPDIFKPGMEVVVEGRFGADGVFHASTLLTKCPSRFRSDSSPSPRLLAGRGAVEGG